MLTDDMVLYRENAKQHAPRKVLDIINEFGKGSEYKIYTQKPLVFLYTNYKRSER